MLKKKRSPYIWVTWLSGLLDGDSQCKWAGWVKANYSYTKRKRDSDLASWKATHNDMVAAHVKALKADEWEVLVEGENKFSIKGKSARVEGKPDIVAYRGDVCLISDIKSGQQRTEHVWQVRSYLALAPMAFDRMNGLVLTGQLVYPDNFIEAVSLNGEDADRIYSMIAELGKGPEPPQSPSESECRFCDISECDARVVTETIGEAAGKF